MSRRLTFVSGLSALCLWAATSMPANAFIFSRTASFSYPCNGTNQLININLNPAPFIPPPGPGGAANIIGASLSLFANPGGVQFVTLSTNDGIFNVVLAQLGQNTNLTTTIFSGAGINFVGTAESATVPVAVQAGNLIPFTVTGNCTGGAGTPAVQGTIVVWFLQFP